MKTVNFAEKSAKIYQKLAKDMPQALEDEVISTIENNPYPTDDEFHELAEAKNRDPHKFEEAAYSVLSDFLSRGRHKQEDKPDLPQKEIDKGVKIEMEHTSNPTLAKRITQDHLTEFGDYNTRLDNMEEKAKKEKQAMQKCAEIALNNYSLVKMAQMDAQPAPQEQRRPLDPYQRMLLEDALNRRGPNWKLPMTLGGIIAPNIAALATHGVAPNLAMGLGSIGPLVGGIGGYALGKHMQDKGVQRKMQEMGY